MTESTEFAAFISYSHADDRFARWLHRQLESYRVPKHLTRKGGTVPSRIGRVFRDRDDLPAADDLSAVVQAALSASRALIVLCSPDSARSKWVNREIEVFRELYPNRPVLAAIVRGEPGAEDEAENCYPPALLRGALTVALTSLPGQISGRARTASVWAWSSWWRAFWAFRLTRSCSATFKDDSAA